MSLISIFSFIALLFSPTVESDPGRMCSCVVSPNPPPVERIVEGAFQSSDAVFMGRVIAGEVVKNAKYPGTANFEFPEYLEFTFSVSEHWKGGDTSTVVVQTGLGGGDCGFAFKMGYKYVVYAKRISEGSGEAYLYTGICDRTSKATNEDVKILRQITGN